MQTKNSPRDAEQRPTFTARNTTIVVLVLGIAAILSYPFDVQLAQFFLSDPLPGELRILIHKTEFFGHGYGILGIALTIYLLDPARRRQIPRILTGALGAGMACNAIKLLIHRVRPCHFSFESDSPTFLGWSFQHATSFSEFFDTAYHSFPSAHTATSVGFALMLGSVYPQGSRWFLALAIMVAASRFDGGAHFVSDTFVGGIIGYLTAHWLRGNTLGARWFDRFESTPQLNYPRLAEATIEPTRRAA